MSTSTEEFDLLASADTGMKENYDGTIVSALFTQSTAGTNTNYSLQLVVAADDGEEVVLRYGVGKDWASFDGGETISHGAGANKRFNARTAYWRFTEEARRGGAEDELQARNVNLYARRGMAYANFWVGLRFHFDIAVDEGAQTLNEEGKWVKVEGGRPYTSPVKYLGTVATTIAAQPSLTDAADLAILTSIARDSADHAEFMAKVSAGRDASGESLIKNREVVVKLADSGWFEGLKAGE